MKKLSIWCVENKKLLKEIRRSHFFVLSLLILFTMLAAMIIGILDIIMPIGIMEKSANTIGMAKLLCYSTKLGELYDYFREARKSYL